MSIGAGIFLLVVGAILAFGVADAIDGVDLGVIGWILMAAGALTIVLALVVNRQRVNAARTEAVEQREDPGDPPVE